MPATTATSAIDWLLAARRGERDAPTAWADGMLLAEMGAASHAG
ncbi:MAG TPA: hypothetical protein VKQ71_08555 [Acidimicrobiales bacterium]|nr:hypothetical protein [Acidimicrobiales bacterium]